MNKRFQNALTRTHQATPPVWMMRQAGRYHQHYQKLRAQHSFLELCKNTELATEVTMGPIMDFDFDVAILFSDLLFPLEAMGLGLEYAPGPILKNRLTAENFAKIQNEIPPSRAFNGLKFQGEAMAQIRERLPSEKSLIGFVGGPWTLFTYAVENEHKGALTQSKVQTKLFNDFSAYIVSLLKLNIEDQLQNGAEVVMIFDTSAGELSPVDFDIKVRPAIQELAKTFHGRIGYYAKGVQPAHYENEFWRSGSLAGQGYDHRFALTDCLKSSRSGFVQGNFDQSLLFLPESEFEVTLSNYLEKAAQLSVAERAGWVCGLGHGVLPGTPEKNVRRFVQKVREVFR